MSTIVVKNSEISYSSINDLLHFVVFFFVFFFFDDSPKMNLPFFLLDIPGFYQQKKGTDAKSQITIFCI